MQASTGHFTSQEMPQTTKSLLNEKCFLGKSDSVRYAFAKALMGFNWAI